MAKWDLSKLPQGRAPIPEEWFKEQADMQERVRKLEERVKWLEGVITDRGLEL